MNSQRPPQQQCNAGMPDDSDAAQCPHQPQVCQMFLADQVATTNVSSHMCRRRSRSRPTLLPQYRRYHPTSLWGGRISPTSDVRRRPRACNQRHTRYTTRLVHSHHPLTATRHAPVCRTTSRRTHRFRTRTRCSTVRPAITSSLNTTRCSKEDRRRASGAGSNDSKLSATNTAAVGRAITSPQPVWTSNDTSVRRDRPPITTRIGRCDSNRPTSVVTDAPNRHPTLTTGTHAFRHVIPCIQATITVVVASMIAAHLAGPAHRGGVGRHRPARSPRRYKLHPHTNTRQRCPRPRAAGSRHRSRRHQ